MAKRAWCSGCRSYVMLTADDMCPYGHPKPSLRGVEEVGYGAPPDVPELRSPNSASMSYASSTYTPATATVTGGGGGFGGGYGYSGSQPTSGFGSPEPMGAYGAPAAAMAAPMPAAAGWQPSPAAMGNPWQSDAMDLDPMLAMQLRNDAKRMDRDVPWTESWAGIIVFLFILWPAGLIFLWRSPLPTTTHKWVITGGIAGLIIFNLINASIMMSQTMARMPVMPVVHR